ncbi:unnamed protein product [Rotaria magnacalcarata]|uniref:C2H2-type domain-containing protein n=1 Tax=Rotaria magnacalcarata TaxID=392030 RepID=A0A816WJ61_9BILA|nr:unnamed protein product [Rotaria magnacalcarata]
MNLLIEQRPTAITSSKIQQQSQISNENDMNNSSPSSPLVLKIKRHTTKQQQQQGETNNSISTSSHMSEEDNNNSRSTTNTQRLKRTSLLNATATRRPSSPAFNGKQQQATKRSVTIDNNNNDLMSNIDDISVTKRFKRDDLNSSLNKVDACVETVSIGLATEPDHLGPCEPGTSVVLEGIVWNETDSGVLVVNVTWRGKTYVGTLLDSTKQDWACPRLTCESPTSDYDARSSSKTSRTKRTGAGGHTRCSNQQSLSFCQQITANNISSGIDDRKLRNNIKSRQSKRLNNLPTSIAEETTNNSSPLTSPYRTNTQTFFPPETPVTPNTSTNLEPQLISCSESHCHKRFASATALSYHISDAHRKIEITSTIPQASTRDEEDVAHILANVADYVRRSSPPSSIRCSPEHQSQSNSPPSNLKPIENSTTLSWPCPQISSNLVLSSALNNTEQSISPISARCKLNNNETNIDQDEINNSVKQPDHFLLPIQNETSINKTSPITNYVDSTITNKESANILPKIPTSPPPLQLTSSSPAYSDISDEDPTPNEQMLPPSTINLLTATNGNLDENGNNLHSLSSSSSSFLSTNGGLNSSNPAWAAQMIFQQFGSFIQPQALASATVSNNKDLSTTPNRLNSNNICPSSSSSSSSNGTSDSSVKNILDGRRSAATKSSSSSLASASSLSPPTSLYPFLAHEIKFPTPIINTLTSPNENLLHLSSTLKPMDILDFSLNNNRTTNGGQYHHSSSLHPSR